MVGSPKERSYVLHYRFIYSHVDDDAAGDCETVTNAENNRSEMRCSSFWTVPHWKCLSMSKNAVK